MEELLAPTRVKRRVGNLLGVIDVNGQGDAIKVMEGIHALWNELNSEDFQHYREAFGKAAKCMPEDYPSVKPKNVYWDNFFEFEQLTNWAGRLVREDKIHTPEFYLTLANIYSHLSVMEVHHKDINAAYRGDHRKN